MDNLKPYIRASHKQLEYIAQLCDELRQVNHSLYRRYSMNMAVKEIKRLKRLQTKKHNQQRQVTLF